MDLQTVIVDSATPQPTHTVVFLHGRGDTVGNFCSALGHWRDSQRRSLAEAFPSFRWVFPQAERRPCLSDWGNLWPQWFDVWNVKDFSDREDLQIAGLKESVISVVKILTREAELLGGRWDRIILAGISQGAATSVHTLLNLTVNVSTTGRDRPENHDSTGSIRRLGGFLGFSCRMPFAGRPLSDTIKILGLSEELQLARTQELLRNTPILLEHCRDDPLVLLEHGHGLRDTMQGFGAERLVWKEYPEGGHWFNAPTGIDDVVEFIKEHILADGTGNAGSLSMARQSNSLDPAQEMGLSH